MTPETLAAQFDVSRETMDRLAAFDALLLDWSGRHNLVARSTIEDRWARHYADSAQLFGLFCEDARTLVDLGSGAGFPGLVLGAMGAERGLQVALVESRRKKADFLRAAIEAMALENIEIIGERIENITISPPDLITARALAQLPKLLHYAHEIAGEKSVCFFPKGLDVGFELTQAAKSWHMEVELIDSITNPGSTIVKIGRLAPRRSESGPKNRQSGEKLHTPVLKDVP